MLKSTLASTGVAALAGAAMLTLSMMAPASAFTLASPSLAAPVAAQHVDIDDGRDLRLAHIRAA